MNINLPNVDPAQLDRVKQRLERLQRSVVISKTQYNLTPPFSGTKIFRSPRGKRQGNCEASVVTTSRSR